MTINRPDKKPVPSYKKQLYLGLLFLLLAIIAAVTIVLLPDTAANQPSSDSYVFKKQGMASFYDKDGSPKCSFEIEIAETPEQQKLGLMYRDSMAVNQGMLFPYAAPTSPSFWMKDTYLPLDIIFIGADSTIVSLSKNTTPFSEERINPKAPAQFVLEINAGLSQKLNLSEGDKFSWKKD
jgi:uncharacterized membrane protein (UPF0127 family)